MARDSINAGYIIVYTDKNNINKKIGIAIVYPATIRVRRIYIGSSKWYTVYLAELYGIVIALEMIHAIRGLIKKDKKVIINTDN